MPHQLLYRRIIQVLGENLGTVLHRHAAQLTGRKKAVILEIVIERRGDGEVARHAGALLQMRKIAGTKINAVQSKDKRQRTFSVVEIVTL